MPLERLLSLNGLSIKDGMVVLAQTQLDIGYENGQEITRENLTQGGRTLRSQGGAGILAEMLLDRMDPEQNTIIDSIRTPDEVFALRSRDDFLLIEVNVPLDLRWKRMQERARDGDLLTTNFSLNKKMQRL